MHDIWPAVPARLAARLRVGTAERAHRPM